MNESSLFSKHAVKEVNLRILGTCLKKLTFHITKILEFDYSIEKRKS